MVSFLEDDKGGNAMKKPYAKPTLWIENFALTEHIADNCGAAAGVSTHANGSQSGCYYPVRIQEADSSYTEYRLFLSNWCSENGIEMASEIGAEGSTVGFNMYDYNGALVTQVFSS